MIEGEQFPREGAYVTIESRSRSLRYNRKSIVTVYKLLRRRNRKSPRYRFLLCEKLEFISYLLGWLRVAALGLEVKSSSGKMLFVVSLGEMRVFYVKNQD